MGLRAVMVRCSLVFVVWVLLGNVSFAQTPFQQWRIDPSQDSPTVPLATSTSGQYVSPALTQSSQESAGVLPAGSTPLSLPQGGALPADVQQALKAMGAPSRQQQTAGQSSSPGSTPGQSVVGGDVNAAMPGGQGTAAPSVPLLPSVLEKQYRESYSSLLSADLHQFGYDIFASMGQKVSQYAVPQGDYIIGPGDTIKVRVWGAGGDGEYEGVVSREGSIDVPQIGIINVAGIRYRDVDQVIAQEAKKYVQGINIKTSLQQLRSVEVYVVGAVQQPGLHMVPAFSTVIDGLLASGGVKKTGTLRDVQLYRNGKLLRSVDLYDLLLKGDRNGDLTLQDRDVVFVPHIHETAAVVGAAIDSAIFELKGESTVGDILAMAGGMLPQGFTSRMSLRRFVNNQDFVVQDIAITGGDASWKAIPIHNGDLLELGFLSSNWPQAIHLEGHVKYPQVQKYVEGMKLSDILTSRDILKPDAVTDFALLQRYDTKTARYTVESFPLGQVFAKKFDLALSPYDRIQILSLEDAGVMENITVAGGVWKPGTFRYAPGITVATAVSLAGGEKFGANPQAVEVSRQIAENGRVKTDTFVIDIVKDNSFTLQPFDYVFVPVAKDAGVVKTVTITGEVRYPGTYRIKDGERLSDVISRAGGFLPDAYFFGARLTTKESQKVQKKSMDSLIRELEIRAQSSVREQAQAAVSAEDTAALKASSAALDQLIQKLKAVEPDGRVSFVLADLDSFRGTNYDIVLQDNSTLDIPSRPSFVTTMGEVYSPSSYLFEPNQTVGYYLAKSGGVAKNGDKNHMYVLRANGEVISASQRLGFFSGFESYTMMPGDVLVVPEDLDKIPYLRLVKDLSDIVFKIATTAGIAFAAF